MPLQQGYGRKTISNNIVNEIRSGKKPAQASAIAYSIARKAKGKWEGGMAGYSNGGKVLDKKSLLDKLFHKKMSMGGLCGYSDGGEVDEDDYNDPVEMDEEDESVGAGISDEDEEEPSREKLLQNLFLKRAMRKR